MNIMEIPAKKLGDGSSIKASYLQRHPNCTITITEEVAALPGAAPK